jgi:hypothetical protein
LELGFAAARGVPVYSSCEPRDRTLARFVRVVEDMQDVVKSYKSKAPVQLSLPVAEYTEAFEHATFLLDKFLKVHLSHTKSELESLKSHDLRRKAAQVIAPELDQRRLPL